MNVTSLGFATDLMLRRLAGATIADRGDHLVIRTPANPGFYWGNFVLAGADLADAQRWLAVFAAEFPDSAHVAIGLDGAGAQTPLVGYAEAGLTPDVSTVLTTRTLVEPRHPRPDARLRPLAGDADWAQALELRLVIDDDPRPAHRLFCVRRLTELRRLTEAGAGVWLGAFVQGRLRSGLGLFSDRSGPARYQAVETHPDYRGQGLASWLVYEAGRYGQQVMAARTLVVVADPDYLAIGIYRALGFADTDRQVQLERAA